MSWLLLKVMGEMRQREPWDRALMMRKAIPERGRHDRVKITVMSKTTTNGVSSWKTRIFANRASHSGLHQVQGNPVTQRSRCTASPSLPTMVS